MREGERERESASFVLMSGCRYNYVRGDKVGQGARESGSDVWASEFVSNWCI